MKNRIHFIITLALCLLMLLAFSNGIFAANSDNYYADEESADGTPLYKGMTITPFAITSESAEDDGKLVIVLDPGHGGADPGANPVKGRYECNLAIEVALACKAYIEANVPNATVYLTHENRYDKNVAKLDLASRAAFAKSKNADMLISLHFNSSTDNTNKGAEVYISCLEEYALEDLATEILINLGSLGLDKRGVKTRVSESGDLWYDELRLADYYGIIRGSCKQEIPSIIVEHCFINNEEEFQQFASDTEKLKALGEADAKAIIDTFDLDVNTDEEALKFQKEVALDELTNVYNNLDPKRYTQYYRDKMVEIYNDATHRIEISTHGSKIDLTLSRAIVTLKNYPMLPYSDVTIDNWFYNAVTFAYNEGIFYGTSETTFSPNRAITRGEFITVIGRMAEATAYYPAQTQFTDVDPEAYYAPYINWAEKNGIVQGINNTTFAPKSDIRREDMLRILHNYCIAQNIEISEVSQKTITDFADGAKTDTWAIDDMNWAIACGLIHGYEDNTLRPTDDISRAETAEILMNFIKMISSK